MGETQAALGAVALVLVAVALVLALTMLVLLEVIWTLGLWASLRRRWNLTIGQLQDANSSQDRAQGRRGH
jgi:hypothetical protein